MKSDDDFNKHFDLEPTEFRGEARPEPFLGYNGKIVLILFAASFPIGAIATWLVTGQFPYWVKPILESLGLAG
jgi:hypothetical protein